MEGPSQAAVSGASPIWSGINFQAAIDIFRSENHLRNNQLVQQARPARQEAELIPTRQVNKGA